MKFAVCVTFKIVPEYWDEFMELMQANAATSLTVEEGCMQFDVCTDEGSPHEVFLYEIYVTPDAFQVHLASAHFKHFDAKVSKMIMDKQVKTYSMVT